MQRSYSSHVCFRSGKMQRVDIVWDVCQDSMKLSTRANRGTRERVCSHAKLPENCKKHLLRNDDNKDEMFRFLG